MMLLTTSPSTLAALCAAFFALSHATPSSTVVPSPSPTTISQSGCPSAIGLTNGGFESGQIAPWTLAGNTDPSIKQKIISPGNNKSKYALQVDFPASNLTEYTLDQQTTGKECFGYYYNISYSWNWAKYTGPEGSSNPNGACKLSVGTGYTSGGPNGDVPAQQHYATRTPGWHHYSYIGRDVYSHGKPLYASYVVDVICQGEGVLPGFTLLLDDFKIANAPGNPNPPPSGGN